MSRKPVKNRESRFYHPKMAILIFIAIVLIVPFWQSKKIIDWQSQIKRQDNTFSLLISWYAREAEKIKKEVGLSDIFQKDQIPPPETREIPAPDQREPQVATDSEMPETQKDIKVQEHIDSWTKRFKDDYGYTDAQIAEIITFWSGDPRYESLGQAENKWRSKGAQPKKEIIDPKELQIITNYQGTGKPFGIALIGDSFMGYADGIGARLTKEILARYQNTTIYHLVKSGVNITTDAHYDFWQLTCEEILRKNKIDVVIIFFSLVGDRAIINEELNIYGDTKKDWEMAYIPRVSGLLEVFDKNEVIVFWVGAPIMREEKHGKAPRNVNPIIKRETEKYQNAYFVDTWPLFIDEQGNYTPFLLTEDGYRLARTEDGMHFTEIGSQAMTEKILQTLKETNLDPYNIKPYQ